MTSRSQTVIGVVGLALGYAVLAYAGLQWATVGPAVSAIWPATGLAIAALMIGGKRLWPAVFIGSFLATSVVPEPHAAATRLLIAGGDCAALVLVVWALQRYGDFDRDLRRVRDVVLLYVIGGLASGVISGLVAVAALVAFQGLSLDVADAALGRWVVGDLVGVVTVAPVLLTWARRDPLPRDPAYWLGFAGLLGAVAVVGWIAFVSPSVRLPLLPWHVAPLLVATALVLDARAATTVGLLTAGLAVYGSRPGGGVFADISEAKVLAVQQYVVITAATVTLVAVMVEALRRARTAVENEQRYLLTAENEARLRLAQEAGQVGTWDWDVSREFALCSEALLDIFGWPHARTGIRFDEWMERVHPDDLERAVAEVRAAMRGGASSYSSEYRIRLPTGEVRHVDSRARLFRGPTGWVHRVIGVVVDITERKLGEERQRLLMREVDHRAKNALAVVQAVVRLTKAQTQEAFAAAVEGRIQAIARAHNLLAASRWTGASLRKLVDEEIEPYQGVGDAGGERVRVVGPDVVLEPDAAQPLALVLHELVTNAAKHGALSAPSGTVEVVWTLDPDADRLRLTWTERGGPQTRPPTRGGFGSTLISASVERQLHGAVRQHWRRSGLTCELEVPLLRAVRQALVASPAADDARRSVLLVEDEAVIALDMKARLEGLGWRVLGPVSTVDEALRAIEAGHPAAAVLDVNLAGEGTTPVARRLADLGVPFAFSTGYGDYALGAAEFDAPVLVKPVTTEELRNAFDRLDGERTAH